MHQAIPHQTVKRSHRGRSPRRPVLALAALCVTAQGHGPPEVALDATASGPLLDQRRLADPGLAAEQQHRRPSEAGLGDGGLDNGQLVAPPDEPGVRPSLRHSLQYHRDHGGRRPFGLSAI